MIDVKLWLLYSNTCYHLNVGKNDLGLVLKCYQLNVFTKHMNLIFVYEQDWAKKKKKNLTHLISDKIKI